MTGTENMNRIISAHAGTLFFNQVLSRYKGEPTMFKGVRGKKNDYRIMREVWNVPPSMLTKKTNKGVDNG